MKTITFLRCLLLTLLISMTSAARAADKEAYAVQNYENYVYTMTFYYDDLRATRTGKTFNLNEADTSPGWMYDENTKSVVAVVFDESFKDARPTCTHYWFYNMEHLMSIVGMENLNTSEVTSMFAMFAYAGLSGTLDLSVYPNFDTGKVTSMIDMFLNMPNIEHIDVSNFDTRNVTHFTEMFRGCQKLKTVDISSFDLQSAKYTSSMFYECSQLKTIYVGEKWNTDALSSSTSMFLGCTSLVGGKGTKFDSSHTDATYARIDGGASAPGYLTGKFAAPYAVIADGTMTFYYDTKKDKHGSAAYDLSGGTPQWVTDNTGKTVKTVEFTPAFANARPTATDEWFKDMESLTEIKGMKEYLNTENVTSMSEMFRGCTSLESIDVSAFNTSKVTTMAGMFQKCAKVSTLDLRSFDTGKVKDMADMFRDCTALTTIYVGWYWGTSNVTSSNNMFRSCTSLVGGMGTRYNSDYEDAAYAHTDAGESSPGYLTGLLPYIILDGETMTFYYDVLSAARGLTTGVQPVPIVDSDLGAFIMALAHISYSTEYAAVTTAVFDPSFAEYRPKFTSAWFYEMPNLKKIEGMNEYLNTSEVTSMISMFFGCTGLEVIDLRNFDTHKVINMTQMFLNCSNLEAILIGDGWSTENVTVSEDMFKGCTSLVGGAGTEYDPSHTDAAYAHADGGSDNPGYLTDKIAYAVYSAGTLTFYCDLDQELREGTVYPMNGLYETPQWVSDDTSYEVTTVEFDPSFAGYRPETTENWFKNMESLTEIKGMNEYLNTSRTDRMNSMFSGCRSMEVLDLSGFNTDWTEDMSYMFADCASLTTILVGERWVTYNVSNSYNMFVNCRKLVGMAGTKYDKDHIDVAYAHMDEGEVYPGYLTMRIMYVTMVGETMRFYYDTDLYRHGEEKVVRIYDLSLATGRDEIVTVEFDPSFADARPTSAYLWFSQMTKLTTFKGMDRYLNTSEVYDMEKMFYSLPNVKELDLSGFDTHNVGDMTRMFAECKNLKTIYVGDGWNTDNVIHDDDMFKKCSSLVGGEGTEYDEDIVDVTYAHIDGGETNPGYLTKAAGGDVNGDGAVDVADIATIIDVMAGNSQEFKNRADVNGDKNVDVADIATVIDIMAGK